MHNMGMPLTILGNRLNVVQVRMPATQLNLRVRMFRSVAQSEHPVTYRKAILPRLPHTRVGIIPGSHKDRLHWG